MYDIILVFSTPILGVAHYGRLGIIYWKDVGITLACTRIGTRVKQYTRRDIQIFWK
jgi:hypothetical protein